MEPDLRMPDDPTAPDAEWKKIQQNTFTRWCNEHLKCVNQFIYSLQTDLCDGLKLINLLQVLSHKRITRYSKKPTFAPQKRENVAIALHFIEHEEDIKLVSIDAGDIVKGNLKLILGLIWTLILKYQISMPMMDVDDGEVDKNITPKQALMGWVKSKLPPEVKVRNFTTDWNDGIALASLVDAAAPGLFPEWEDMDPNNKLDNATEAMKRAEDWLGVPQIITPEEITNPNVDELSVMTYVSYFPEAKCKPGAPIKQKMTDASKCRAWGPGIEPEGLVANNPAEFFVEATGSSKGKVNVHVLGPGRKQLDCDITDNHDNTYTCTYLPEKPGTYDVHIRIGGHHIPNSPFRVKVSSDLDSSKVHARGPGLEPYGVSVNRWANFEVVATGAGHGNVHIDIIDPKGNKKTEVKIEDSGNSVYSCQYFPQYVGKYVICIKYGDSEIAKSPFRVNVDNAAARVKIYGPGLEHGLKTGKPAKFTVDCTEVGPGNLDIGIEGPGKGDVSCDVEDNGDGTYTCTYKPTRPGTYIIKVTYDKVSVPKCPVKVTVSSSADLSKIRAWGPGLEKGVEGTPAEFYVDAKNTKLDSLTFAVEGPGNAPVEVEETGPHQVTVKYFPEEPGEYTIHVMCEEVDIPTSPFKARIVAKGNAAKVYAEGPGLKPGCMTGRPAEFTVFTHKAGGAGKVEVTCTDEDGNPAEVKMKDNKDDTYSVSYMPIKPGTYTITITFAGTDIPKSPIQVPITPYCDPTKVKVTGSGLKGGKTNKPAHFDIDASRAGEGGIGLTIEGPKEAEIKCDDHGDGTCSVEYLPVEDGDYYINVLFADEHVPGSPFKALVSSDFDASKVKATGPGLEPGCKAGRRLPITVDSRKAGKAPLHVEVTDDVGNPVNVEMEELEPGLDEVFYTPEKPGEHTVKVTFGGKPIPKSPFKVKIEPAADASKVKVSGPGIEPTGVRAEEPTYFEVDASEAGEGNVDISIEPESRRMPKVDNIDVKEGDRPNTYIVTYVPPKKGNYSVSVKFAGDAVPDSPFKVSVEPGVDSSKCRAYGPGLEEAFVGEESPFTVECEDGAGPGKLSASVENPDGSHSDVLVKDNRDGTFTLTWVPDVVGPHKVQVKFGGKDIPGSAFTVNAVPKPDASKVKVYGPGLDHANVNKPNQFFIDTKDAGAGNLGLAIEGPAEAKIDCTDNGDGTCTVNYVPIEEGDHEIIVKFAEENVPNSPFIVPASVPVDASQVKCSGDGLNKNVLASFPQEFLVDASKAGKAPLDVEITGPDRKPRKPDVTDNGDGTFTVKYVPDKDGRYTIGVKYGGESVPQSPFRINANPTGDASKCKVSGPGVKNPLVGKPSPFEVDARKAGKGKVTPKVCNPHGDELPCTVEEVDNNVYACNWTPEEPGEHTVDVNFGGQPVNGSPFKPNAIDGPDTSPINTDDLAKMLADEPVIDQPVESVLDCSELEPGQLEGVVTTPSGEKDKVKTTSNNDGTYDIDYTPRELGLHTLDVTYDSVPVPGSPFKFKVVKPGPRKVKVFGPGLKKGYVNKPNAFIIDTKGAGPGNLSLAVEGPSKADVECVDNGDGTCTAVYIPKEPGTYDIFISFAGQDIPGAPLKVKVVDEEPILEVGKEAQLNMAPDDVRVPSELPVLSGVLASPTKDDEPVDLSKGPNDTLRANFTPVEAGKNDLHLKKRGKEVKGSPVPLLVRDKPEVGKPCKIPLELADVDRKDVKKLKGSLIRPNGKKEPLDIDVTPDGVISVTFVPEEPGKHIINIKKNKKHVEDSPYVIMVPGDEVEGPPSAIVGSPCDVNLDLPDVKLPDDLKDLSAVLERPNGEKEPCEVGANPDNTLSVSFVPKEPGLHLIHIKKKRKPVRGSPFKVMVGEAPKESKNPTVGNPCDVNLDFPDVTLPDDLPDLSAVLERPSGKREPVDIRANPDNTIGISFVPEEPGLHKIHIKKKRRPIKDSPIEIMVDEAPEAKNPTVGNPCDVNLELPDINLPDDLPFMTAILERPTGKREKVPVKANPDNSLAVSFTPEETGLHKIHVKKSGKPVKGSPFNVMVGDEPVSEDIVPETERTQESLPDFLDDFPEEKPSVGSPHDANLKIPGIKIPDDLPYLKGVLARPSGETEPVDLKEGPNETLSVAFTPKEPGEHLLHIKKHRKEVPGSPFKIMVEDEPKKGPCVGNPCDVNLDFPDVTLPDDLPDLSAVLERPSGKREPVDIRANPDNTIGISFVPEEPGLHKIHIKKKRRPIKDSPIEIMVDEAPEAKNPTVGNPCDVNLELPDVNLPDDLPLMTAILERPTGKREKVPVKANPDNSLAVSFTPKEPGLHKIHVKKSGKPVKGSPFNVMVDDADAKAPTVGNPCDINMDLPSLNLPEDLKKLKGTLTRPNGKKEPIELTANPDNTLGMSFVPKEPGKHVIDITKDGRPVEGSPIEIMVVDDGAKKPKVGDECDLGLDIPDLKLPEDLDRLTASLKRPSKTREEPIDIGLKPDNSLSVKFVPEEPGEHLVSVKKDKRHVKGSPFSVIIEDQPVSEDIVPATEDTQESLPDFLDDFPEEKPSVGSPHDANLKIPGIKIPEDLPYLSAVLARPSGETEPLDVKEGPNSTLSVAFTPKESGDHLLHLKKHNKEVPGSPFKVVVEGVEPKKSPAVGSPCDVNLVLPDINLPKDLPYLKAKLTRPTGKKEPLNLSVGPDNSLSMNFTPTETGKHLIDIEKNGRPIKQSPITIIVEDEEKSKAPTVGKQCDVNLDIDGISLPRDLKDLTASLKRPTGKEEPLEVKANDDNSLNLSFVPTEPGEHYITVKKNRRNVNGSPFLVMVEMEPEPDRAPTVGSPCDVAVELPDLRIPEDLKYLKCTLERPDGSVDPLEPKAGPDNTLSVKFVPDQPGKHLINIKKDRRHVKGSPIEVMVKDAKPRKPGQPCAIGLEIPGIRVPEDLPFLKATVTSPSGSEEPVDLKAGPNNRTIVVSFMPKEVGKHLLNIKKNGRHVQNSPYEVIVKPEDLPATKPDASKVRAYGKGLDGGPVNTKMQFIVDTRDAGYGGLGLSIEGPSKVEINCVDNEDGTCTVDFTPDEPGTYNVNVTYADEHIPGSPFKPVVTDVKGRRPVDDDVGVPVDDYLAQNAPDMDYHSFPSTKAPQDFVIKFTGSGDLNATVTRPSGVEDPADVIEAGKDQYTIRFIPRETGEHKVNVKHRNRHIPGSPFKVYVDAPSGGAKACTANGPGLESGVAGQPCRFTVNTRDAGPGGLAVAVEGPAKAEIQCNDNGDGTCDITWYPVEAGEYTIHIRFADEPISESPFTVSVVSADEVEAMSMSKFKEQVLRPGQQASFAVQMKGKDGKVSASVVSPSGAELDCSVVEVEKENFAVKFVPKELGDHRVSVFLDGHHIPGSAFIVKVAGGDVYPGKVRAYGQGLKAGVVNQEAAFTVDALNAGTGALALSIDGPAKVKMNCMEQADGTYSVTYKPTLTGNYVIGIRFADENIPGSPFNVKIVSSEDSLLAADIPDASKCTSKGAGLRHANVNEVASFTVNASGAGRGSIMVGVEGPIVPAKEIIVKHTGNNIYTVDYILEQKDNYILRVLWGGFDIPGSPFHITV